MSEDSAAEEPRGGAGARRIWYPRLTLSLSAFIMSLAITLINAFYSLQGAEIAVRPPEQIILYRDGEGSASVLSFAVRLDMINAATTRGDVMLDAELRSGASGGWFRYQSVTTPVFTDKSAEAAKGCALGSRCVALPGLLLIEKSDEIVDVPSGAARAVHLSFTAAGWNCEGRRDQCAAYSDFEQSLKTLGKAPLDVFIRLDFHNDGSRLIRCRASRGDMNYLAKVGWLSLPCESRSVTGDPLL